MWIIIEYLCCAFLLATGAICLLYAIGHHRGTSQYRDVWSAAFWRRWAMSILAFFIGAWHLVFGVLKTFYVTWGLLV